MSSFERKNESPNIPALNGTSSNKRNDKDNQTRTGTNGETIGDQPNGNSSAATSTSSKAEFPDTNGGARLETLKIIGHIRNIEKINENRRIFLSNTLTETAITSNGTTDEKSETSSTTTTTSSKIQHSCPTKDDKNSQDRPNNVLPRLNEECHVVQESSMYKTNGDRYGKSTTLTGTLPALKSPLTPPPKPPMLSRTRSLGVGDHRPSSMPPTPTTTSRSLFLQQSSQTPPIPSTTTAIAVSVVSVQKPNAETTICLRESSPVLRRLERPVSVMQDPCKHVSMNHYERIIEELRCPGCAAPMKAPILLCKTGHSVCSQCTRVLMMCPLCKEPFTPLRSRTVEALCAKAHFRCCNACGGCNVRLQTDLLAWHEKQCIYKPMKCFMGRVWGDCHWSGREIDWKDHLESAHRNRLFKSTETDLIWNMSTRQRPLTGYYVFDIFGELFNFYEIYDNERVLFTMTCTSTLRERKHHFAYEVTITHPNNDALAITQKFPVHSEYDKDILAEGTCVSITLSDLAKFVNDDKLLHYRVRLLEVSSPRKAKNFRYSVNPSNGMHPIDFQQTQIEGANLKGVPDESIVTRKVDDLIPFVDNALTPTSVGTELEAGAEGLNDDDVKMRKRYYSNESVKRESSSESDPEFEAYIAKKWGTPQMHFNRKFLKNSSIETASTGSSTGKNDQQFDKLDDKSSVTSWRNTNYTKKVTNTLRKSFRSLKTPIVELKSLSFIKRSPEKKTP